MKNKLIIILIEEYVNITIQVYTDPEDDNNDEENADDTIEYEEDAPITKQEFHTIKEE